MADFTTPVGRIVQGNVFKGQTTDSKGQPLIIKTGPNKGQPRTNFFIAIAFSKADVAFNQLYALIVQVARQGYPQHFDATGNCTHPRMTYKISDGDGVDADGKSNAQKEGWAGHWVLKCSSSYAPKAFYTGRFQPHEQIQDHNAIKCGDFVRVMGTIEPNIGSDVPGVYINHNIVELCGIGTAISTGADPAALAALPPPVLPAGATALPAAGAPGAMPTPMATPGSAGALPGVPAVAAPALPGIPVAAPALPTPTPAPAVTPNPALVDNALTLPGTVAPLPVAAAPVYVMSPEATAGGHTRESLNAQGYTDAVLIANGWMKQQ